MMMNSLIEELFYSNLNPWYGRGGNGVEKEPMFKIDQSRKDLLATLTDEQKAIFEAYEEASHELADIRELQIFKTGFQYGMRLAFEGTSVENE